MNRLLVIFSLIILSVSSSLAQFQMEDPVEWNSEVVSAGDGIYEILFTADIEDPWHMYAIKQEQEGPIPTSFSFEDVKGVELIGDLKELIKPKIKFDEGFRFNVGAYYNEAKFSQNVKVTSAETVELNVTVEYQNCNDETCLPPFTDDFSFQLKGAGTVSEDVKEKAEPDMALKDAEVSAGESAGEEVSSVGDEEDRLSGGIAEEVDSVSVTEAVTGADVPPATGDRSMGGFLVLTFLLGLAAILTPCVYPMIPMTISFFMRGVGNKVMVVVKGLVFGFSIILVYTGLGVLVALTGLDANFGNIISTHWIPNIIFFLLFLIFAASFLGMFEIVLPSSMINKVDKQADKGGLVGPFFMGLTTVLVSFSCTGPIVGSLLSEAAGGDVAKPILGMFFFSLAFALPFTLLAIFPGMMKNLPKSGGWLNSVKVVLGFLMLAFGFKFLSAIDQSYHLNIFSREVYIAIWFVITMILGFYLLGKIRFSHDSPVSHISVPRLLLAMATFVFAIYLFTGILGNDMKAIAALMPPKTSQSFSITGTGAAPEVSDQTATYCGPGEYNDIFHLPYGLKGYFTYEDGMECAREKDKPVFLDFTGHSCSNCKQMESQVWSDPEVLELLRDEYVIISLYTDDKTKLPENEWITADDGDVLKTIGERNVHFEINKFQTFATPWYVLLDPQGNVLTAPIGKELDINKFREFLEKGIENFKASNE